MLLLGLLAAYWAVSAVWLLAQPLDASGALMAGVLGAILVPVAAVYGLVTWGTARRSRGWHLAALVVAALGALLSFTTAMSWQNVALAAVNLAVLVLLALTIPRPKGRPNPAA